MPQWLPKALALLTALSLHATLWLAVPGQPEVKAQKEPIKIDLYKAKKPVDRAAEIPRPLPEPLPPPPQPKPPKKAVRVKKAIIIPENSPVTPPPVENIIPQKEKPENTKAVLGLTLQEELAAQPAAIQLNPGNNLQTGDKKNVPTTAIAPLSGSGKKERRIVMAETLDRLPTPIGACHIPFPPEAEELGLEGDVVLSLNIDEKGLVTSVKLVKSLSPILDKSAIRGIRACRFTPARSGGEPVAVIGVTYRYSFILD